MLFSSIAASKHRYNCYLYPVSVYKLLLWSLARLGWYPACLNLEVLNRISNSVAGCDESSKASDPIISNVPSKSVYESTTESERPTSFAVVVILRCCTRYSCHLCTTDLQTASDRHILDLMRSTDKVSPT